jgi:hypothetical protein
MIHWAMIFREVLLGGVRRMEIGTPALSVFRTSDGHLGSGTLVARRSRTGQCHLT